MKIRDLTEAADNDLRQIDVAKGINKRILSFLVKNEDRPVRNLPGAFEAQFRGFRGYCVRAGLTLGSDLSDLSFGFAYGREGAKAVLLRAKGDKPHYLALFCMESDPGDETDIAFKVSWNDMVHELVHYLDYKRGYDRGGIASPKRDAEVNKLKDRMQYSYYNDPLELNAYYGMALSDIIDQIKVGMKREGLNYYNKVLGTFESFKGEFKREFRPDWVRHLTPENKKRFEKRFYLLWKHLSDNLTSPQET